MGRLPAQPHRMKSNPHIIRERTTMTFQYPEHDKLSEISEASQAIGEFLESLSAKGIELAAYGTGDPSLDSADENSTWHKGHPERLYPVHTPIQTLLAEHFEIDTDALEAEKRQMLEGIQGVNADPEETITLYETVLHHASATAEPVTPKEGTRLLESDVEDWDEVNCPTCLAARPSEGIPEIPAGFWAQIGHQLDRLIATKADTFAAVREILLDPAYTEIQTEIHHNGHRTFRENAAFFAGSGGNRSILGTLSLVGWVRTWSQASYYYDLVHPETQETIEYIEGDLYAIDADATPHHL